MSENCIDQNYYVGILSKFKIKGEVVDVSPYGEGHINETFLVITQQGCIEYKYIFQRINSNLFTRVDKLMNNIKLVTEFARKKIIERGGDPERETLNIVDTKDGSSYYYDKENDKYFRIYIFIDNAIAYQQVQKPEDFYQSAVAFGDFAKLLAQFDASQLFEVIPDFHNTVKRLTTFKASLEKDAHDRAKDVQEEIKFVLDRADYAKKIVSLLQSGEMPTKVTHNDTKLNNVMLDSKTDKYLAVIDLDTIMPGSICYDFGDAIRFGCNSAAEDEQDLSKVYFQTDLFEVFTKGYLTSLGADVTEIEKEHLVWGAILMTYECGMRFLTDYLDGDVYFRTHRPKQNLDRARTQFKLVSDMEKNFELLQNIVKNA